MSRRDRLLVNGLPFAPFQPFPFQQAEIDRLMKSVTADLPPVRVVISTPSGGDANNFWQLVQKSLKNRDDHPTRQKHWTDIP